MKKCWGNSPPRWVCTSKPWSFSNLTDLGNLVTKRKENKENSSKTQGLPETAVPGDLAERTRIRTSVSRTDPLHQTSRLYRLYMSVVGTPSRLQYQTLVLALDGGGVIVYSYSAAVGSPLGAVDELLHCSHGNRPPPLSFLALLLLGIADPQKNFRQCS